MIPDDVLGVADPLVWLSILKYFTDSYPKVAGSIIAAFLISSQLLAAVRVHRGTCSLSQGINPFYVVSLFFARHVPGPQLFGT